jgi:hypothetical protein
MAGPWDQAHTHLSKHEAAQAIADASGFSALWIATGKGPKMTPHVGATTTVYSLQVEEPRRSYLTIDQLVRAFGDALAHVPPSKRQIIARNLSDWAIAGGGTDWHEVIALLLAPDQKGDLRATGT